jgi:hypothetical protein
MRSPDEARQHCQGRRIEAVESDGLLLSILSSERADLGAAAGPAQLLAPALLMSRSVPASVATARPRVDNGSRADD